MFFFSFFQNGYSRAVSLFSSLHTLPLQIILKNDSFICLEPIPQRPQSIFRQLSEIHWLVIGWRRCSIFRLFGKTIWEKSIWEPKSMTIDSKLHERDKINSFLARFGLKTDWKLQKPAGDQSWFSSLVFITSPQCQIITVFFMKVQNGMTGNATVVSLDDKVDLCFKLNWSPGDTKISLYAGHKWMFSRSISPHTCRCSGNEAAIYWWMIYWGMTRNWRTCRPHIFHHSVSSGIKLAPQEKERKSVMLQHVCHAFIPSR